MKIFKVDFEGIWPVPHGLIIAANDIEEATSIASNELIHTNEFTINEVDISKPTVIFYEDGDY